MVDRRSSWSLAAFAAPCLPIAALGLPLVVYLPEFYASDLGLSLSAVGAAFIVVRVIDILFDPLIGGLMDRTRTRWGRFRPWLVLGSPLIMAGAFALFMARPGIGPVYLWFWLIVVYAGYSMMVVSQTAWGSVLSKDYRERSRVYGWWQAGNVVGMILVLTLPPIVSLAFKGDHTAGMRSMGWFVVLLTPLTVFLATRSVGEPPAPAIRHASGLPQYLDLLKRSSVRKLLVADLLMGLAPGIAGALFFFFFERIKHFDKTQAGVLLLVYFIAALAGAPLWSMLAKRIGKHNALAVASVVYAVVQVCAVITPAGDIGLALLVLVLAGIPYAAAPLLVRAMMADIGDEERLASGVDRTGLLYAIVNGAIKLGHALSIGAFPLLALFGFDPKLPTATGEAALIALYSIVPAALGLVVAAVMLRYPLDATRVAEIQRQLAARDAAESSPQEPKPDPNVALAAQTP